MTISHAIEPVRTSQLPVRMATGITVFCVARFLRSHGADVAAARMVAQTRRPAVVPHRIAQHGYRIRVEAEALHRRYENLPVLPVVLECGHGKILFARRGVRVFPLVARHADLVLRLFVIGLYLVVGYGPVGEGGILYFRIKGVQFEILRHEPPRHRAVCHRSGAHARGVEKMVVQPRLFGV